MIECIALLFQLNDKENLNYGMPEAQRELKKHFEKWHINTYPQSNHHTCQLKYNSDCNSEVGYLEFLTDSFSNKHHHKDGTIKGPSISSVVVLRCCMMLLYMLICMCSE